MSSHKLNQLLRQWTSRSHYDKQLDATADLLRFLGDWLYSAYRPFPEKPHFWDRLYSWIDHVSKGTRATRRNDQQALFNFVPWLLFAAEEDLISTYRTAYQGPICRWLLKQAQIKLDSADLKSQLEDARTKTWFGSLAGMDINTFCRVNGIFGQSYRPEMRFLAKFCDMGKVAAWLKKRKYERVVIVEDIVGTGEQFRECLDAIKGLVDFNVLFVPLFIAPEGHRLVSRIARLSRFDYFEYEPLFVLPHECLVKRRSSPRDSDPVRKCRRANKRQNDGLLGFGNDGGTLVLTYLNCPDNVPPIFHEQTPTRPVPLFPRASREG